MSPITSLGTIRPSQTMLDEALALYSGSKELSIQIEIEPSYAQASCNGKSARVPVRERSPQKSAKYALYCLLAALYGYGQSWGCLTGVKPLKKYSELAKLGMAESDIALFFSNTYGTSQPKIDLLKASYEVQQSMALPSSCVYINIPLCPAKCSYCSFPSKTAVPHGSECELYAQSLIAEIHAIMPYFTQDSKEAACLYIGGGTPAMLSASQTAKVLDALYSYSPKFKEATFEAGRSDLATVEKLELLKEYGFTRLCINPQTFNEPTLRQMNRDISNESFFQAFGLAKELGFTLNSDLILGFPNESARECDSAIDKLIGLEAENITLHALCKKRTSSMDKYEAMSASWDVSAFQDFAREKLGLSGYRPYYLYKQKDSANAAENVGYSKPGFECAYNTAMMGEVCDIIGLGANATTNIVRNDGTLAKIYNIKDFILYNNRIEEICAAKIKKIEYERESKTEN
ncbi:MAG: coproporphyrinogen dehydrogenase HemZ [Eubacteriaceae bacterium]|nr:coproporphyrinogen dehydrogenase HemZ [Eubacteriaceae bacterium]